MNCTLSHFVGILQIGLVKLQTVEAYDLSDIQLILQYVNGKCIGYVIKTIKVLTMHLNIKYLVQFLFFVVSQSHSCGF